MKQYNQIKAKHPKALLLFRVGDFYETFGQDAIVASKILGIVLTHRKNGAAAKIELAGFPHHSLETYLPKLVRSGQRVAVCDQLEDPKLTKKIVKRGVTELVTPGVSFNDQVLDKAKNNFLCAIHFSKLVHGISFIDVTTGEFLYASGKIEYLDKLVSSMQPSEIVFQKNKRADYNALFSEKYYSFAIDDWAFQVDFAEEKLLGHFETNSLKGFGINHMDEGVIAAGAILHYLNDNHQNKLQHIRSIKRIEEDSFVWMDRFTIRNLELVQSPNEDAITLIDVMDKTLSPMGARLLKRWVLLPLKDSKKINARLDFVDALFKKENQRNLLSEHLKDVGDLERLVSKVSVQRVNPRELIKLKETLNCIPFIKEVLSKIENKETKAMSRALNPCKKLSQTIEKHLLESPAVQVGKGPVINNGLNKDLDSLREILSDGKSYLDKMQQKEMTRTGISSLKISFNNVFGYYFEVRNTHKDKVPEEWIRKQTLVNAERYITEKLKEYEHKILGAEDKIRALETRLFNELVEIVSKYIEPIQKNAFLLAKLDCFCAFALISEQYNYSKPSINNSLEINIKNGRHPVIEKSIPAAESYIPNDVFLDENTQQIMMITGPNMSGKSALLRQTALIVLMAQVGCFVPAERAEIGIVDKIFTRVGASDNISSGESTFMVEMNETASILNNLSKRSLILLDEIGRGTSTYDGISIAWAIAEYLHEFPNAKAKTLFATHYHELNSMSSIYPRIKNFNVSVKEMGKRILFLRKLVEGGSEHSFGIHVARLAGMPLSVIKKSEEILIDLESKHKKVEKKQVGAQKKEELQLSFFQLDDPVLQQIHDELMHIDINSLTPIEALMKLNEIKKLTGG
ncbi:MAG: DNA mismatch repair protein MutS [Crocinitomicaceae bacterium]|nr:DNA mismatch repair protein MutS [Crocinitomicaceae bacterium]